MVAEQPRVALPTTTSPTFVLNARAADLLAGCAAGVTGKIVEYPFDTVKVLLQCQTVGKQQYSGSWDCFVKTLRGEGAMGFYRGFTAPLYGSIIENAVLFTIYGQLQKLMKNGSDEPLSIAQLSTAGFMAGSVVSLVLTPVELLKCKMQMNRAMFKGAADCFLHTVRTAGITGMYKGHAATFMRESFGGAAWFGCYEFICQRMSPDGNKDKLSPWALLGAGALGGVAYNAIMFPADVVKSQIQAEAVGSSKPSYMKRLAHLYRGEGVRGLYRGFGVTLCRAVPANAVIFGTYEFCLRLFSGATDNALS